MTHRRYCLLTFMFLSMPVVALAQSKGKGGFGIEANFTAGKIFKHTKKFRPPIPDLSTSYELNFIRQTNGEKAWHQRRGYPVTGFAVSVTDYGIDSIYGKCISIYPNIEIPVIKGKKLEWTIRAGFGLGYVTKRYERHNNWDTLNNVIGSKFNNYTTFATDVRYRINEHWDVQVGGNFSHISNGLLRLPNYGINMFGGHIGLRYFPVTSQPPRIQRTLKPLSNRWLIQGRLSFAFTELNGIDGPLYPVYMASLYASKRYLSKNKAFIGLDYAYHESMYAFLRNNEIHEGNERFHSWKSAVFIGNEFLIGRVGVVLQLGYYIKDFYFDYGAFYQKLGGNLYIIQREDGLLKEMFLSIMLKAHKVDAELAEVGIGFGF